jgi:hypothetical protein
MGATPETTDESTTVRTITLADGKGEATYESDMPMKHLNQIMDAARDNDLGELQAGLAAFTLSWPFDGEPSDVAAWGELKRTDFNAMSRGILKDLGTLGNE